MSQELVERKFRKCVPYSHRQNLDTRIVWLWNQRFGTVQTVWLHSEDVLDKTAATLILQAVMERNLESIRLLFQRVEGGAQVDEDVLERAMRI